VWFQPVDQIGGDFYSWSVAKDGSVVLGLADSVGHGIQGVVGASLAYGLLKRAVSTSTELSIAARLVQFESEYHELFKANTTADEVSTFGCELALFSYNPKSQTFTYSSAGISIISALNDGVNVFDKDKYSFSDNLSIANNLTTHDITLKKGQRLIVYTDGLKDQLGGSSNKTWGKVRLLESVMLAARLPFDEFVQAIKNDFSAWKAANAQTDDITCIFLEA
jgi:serine phosphatase RsbU (regulator of sigma subunit)